MSLVNILKSAAHRLRDRAARPAPARAGRQLQEHDRPPAQEGAGALLAHRRRRHLHLPVARGDPRGDRDLGRLPDARGAAAPRPGRAPRRGPRRAQSARRSPAATRSPSTATSARSAARCSTSGWPATTATGRSVLERHPRPPPDPLRAGPRRHRHVPAQGREEPGRDRADRRHQLPQDRRVRHRERPAGVQLRRRVQHRQPRHHRVHRGPQARRRLPLRPARGEPGTQDQAEEVRPDRHRRGDHRPHERAGIQEAPVQRVHGGAPRPDGEDRRAVRHAALATRSRSTRRTTTRGRSAASRSRRTRSKSRRCGRC